MPRPDTSGSDGKRGSGAASPRAQHRGGSGRRVSSSRDFLVSVLAPNREGSNNDTLPEAVPIWKEEMVERVRRRAAAARAERSPRGGAAAARAPSAGMVSPRAAARRHVETPMAEGAAEDEGASIW